MRNKESREKNHSSNLIALIPDIDWIKVNVGVVLWEGLLTLSFYCSDENIYRHSKSF